jgi:hypothetical protein
MPHCATAPLTARDNGPFPAARRPSSAGSFRARQRRSFLSGLKAISHYPELRSPSLDSLPPQRARLCARSSMRGVQGQLMDFGCRVASVGATAASAGGATWPGQRRPTRARCGRQAVRRLDLRVQLSIVCEEQPERRL